MTPTEKLEAELEKKLAREYRKAKRELTIKLEKHLARFKDEDEIYRKMVKDGEIEESEYLGWRKEELMYSTWVRDMRDTICKDLYAVKRIATDIANDYNVYSFCESVNWETYQIEHDSQISTSFTLYSKNTISALLKENPSIMPRRVDRKKDFKWNKRRITSALVQSTLQGESVDHVAERLRKTVDMNYGESVRAARTMMNSATQAGKQEAIDRAIAHGIPIEKGWIATLDLRTRHSHREMDMEFVDGQSKFSNGMMYPGDWSADIPNLGAEIYNCRCDMIIRVADIPFDHPNRSSKLGSMSYEDWKSECKGRGKNGSRKQSR